MAKIIISRNGKVVSELNLDKERTTIGRRPDNDLIIEGDPAVSGHHAAILTFGSESFLEDQNSTNGTLVNGKAVSKHPLTNGDVIGIGHHELRFEAVLANDEEFEKTMVLSAAALASAGLGGFGPDKPKQPAAAPAAPPASAGKPPSAPAAPPAAPAAPAGGAQRPLPGATPLPNGKVVVSSGPNSGRALQLTKALTTLGKPGVQVAAITRRADGYFAVHVGPPSTPNRPTLNGDMLDNKPRKLSSGDTLVVAGTQMKFELE